MQKIDERSLKLKAEDYFDYCKNNRRIRGLWVITDKQSIFYSQVLRDDYRTHDNIQIDIENEIHPNNQIENWGAIRPSHACIASAGVELEIYMPDNGKLSYSQAKFITDALNIVEKFNSNEENKRKIKINLYEPPNKESKYDVTAIEDIKLLKDKLQNEITHNIDIEEEKIIGTTLPKEEVINNILSNLNAPYRNVDELSLLLGKCKSYIYDDYYKDVFIELIPNYKNIKKLFDILKELYIQSDKIETMTLDNLEETLYNLIKNSFKNKKTFNDILDYLDKLQYQDRTLVNELFPNYELLLKCCKDIRYIDKNELDMKLEKCTSYDDILKVITSFTYSKNKKELLEKEKQLNNYNESLEEIEITKNIISSKDHLNNLINNRKEKYQKKNEYTFNLEENSRNITSEEKHQESINELIKESSSNFIKRIIFRKRIKQYKHDLQESINKMESLKKDNQGILDKINALTKEINSIEVEFKSITKFEYIPDSASVMDYYYQRDITEYEKNTLDLINWVKKDITKLTKTLEAIDKSNILKDSKKVEEIQKSMKEDTEDIVTSEDKTIKDISINTTKRTARNI